MLRLPRLLVMAWILGAACIAAGSAQAQGDEGDLREVIDLMTDWRFHLGDPAGAEQPGFDDAAWRTLDLPHDWAFEGGVSKDGAQRGGGGYFSAGVGWYRHTLVSPPLEDDQQLTIDFDGVYMNSEVWINGHRLGRFPYGYLSFSYDLTPHLKPGENVLAVRCDNTKEPSTRWYHPCGIYAPVRLVIKNEQHVDHVFVTTPRVSGREAVVNIQTAVSGGRGLKIDHRVLGPDGAEVGRTSGDTLTIKSPRRWGPDTPDLYTLVTTVSRRGEALDRLRTRFGIRSTRWEAKTGFWLNGENVKLRGVCEHWEAGPVGGAWTPELMRWKLEELKAIGVNAIRTAHNPFPPFFYDLCDEMGLMVMDEVFDGWRKKAKHDYGAQAFAERWETDLRAWLIRDRNHPSIVIWSVGNETRGKVAPKLVQICHELDPTRPVTSGHAGAEFMDVYGVNGGAESQGFFRGNRRPKDKPFIATEAPHTWQVRGYYRSLPWFRDGLPDHDRGPFPLPDLTEKEIFTYDWADPATKRNPRKQIFNSSYDNATVRISARQALEQLRDFPFYAGQFRWTGWDYLGEASYVHGGFPFRAFMGGAFDLAGFPKDLAFLYQSQWTDEPMVHLLPHWTHPKMAPDTLVPIWAYSNAEEVELFFDDTSLGIRKPGRAAMEMQCQWLVPWRPGTLTAVARDGGTEVARTSQTTAGPPARLGLDVERRADGLRILTARVTDDAGTLAPYADNRVYVALPEEARLLAHESGSPVDTDNNVTLGSRRAFMGLTRSFVEVKNADATIAAMVGAILGSRNGVTDS